MSELTQLEISAVRNLLSVRLQPEPGTNLIYGENGSGKTSLLEAIHLLATGRSFRSGKIESLINNEQETATVFAKLAGGAGDSGEAGKPGKAGGSNKPDEPDKPGKAGGAGISGESSKPGEFSIGLEKTRQQGNNLRLNGQTQQSWEQVARELPVQVLDAHSFQLLEGGPKARRRFLDWGVFHVEHEFLAAWRTARKCLTQRNLLLKQQPLDRDQIAVWDTQLSQAAEIVDRTRQTYFALFLPRAEAIYGELNSRGDTPPVALSYDRGWPPERPLIEVLRSGLALDIRYRATQQGPHRADIIVSCGRSRAVDILSRGQQKLLVCAMKLAQGSLLTESLGKHCIYLVDDLPAELDQQNAGSVLAALQAQGGQLFVTSVQLSAFENCVAENSIKTGKSLPKFHVEHGRIRA
ncbi:MAG: DNA replication/repair protein RecF [Pseudohongiellaceae bacterium]